MKQKRKYLLLLMAAVMLTAALMLVILIPDKGNDADWAAQIKQEISEENTAMVTEWVDRVYAGAEIAKPAVQQWLDQHNAALQQSGTVEYFPYNIHCLYPTTNFSADDYFGREELPGTLAEYLKTARFMYEGMVLPAPGDENRCRQIHRDENTGQWNCNSGIGGSLQLTGSVNWYGTDANLYRNTVVRDLSAFDFGEITDMCFLSAREELGGISFVYVLSEGTEYLVPYGGRPEITHLVQGKVYTAQQLHEHLWERWYGQN